MALGKIAYLKALLLDEDPFAHLKAAIDQLSVLLPSDHPYLVKVQTA